MAKEDTAQNRLLDFVSWLDAHRKQVLIGSVIAIVVVGGGILFFYQQGQREIHASEALSEVHLPQSAIVPPSGTAEAYLKVANDYSGSKAAARAVLEAAGVYYTQGRYADAQKQFERIGKEFPGSPWQAEGAIGVAASLEAQGKGGDALAKYDELRKRYANSPVVDTAKLNMARLYEQQNKPAEALKLYEEVMKLAQANPYSGLGNEAGMRMEELLEKHPELSKTNAPPPLVTQIPTPGQSNQTSAVRTITLSNLVQQARTNIPAPPSTNVSRPPITITNRITPTGSVPPAASPNPPNKAP